MTNIQAIILGITQGATEFLPISSSGHLILVPKIMGISEQPLVFDTTMHLATAITLIVYFFSDYISIIKDFFSRVRNKQNLLINKDGKPSLMLLLLSSLPAGLLGLLFDDVIENTFRSAGYVAIFMLLGTFLMLIAEKISKKQSGDLTVGKGIKIGLFQSLALFPGVSRSGSTISGGMILGLSREYAARFSFLLSVPIVLAASFFKLISSDWVNMNIGFVQILLGFISSFITGILAVKFLLNYLKNKSLRIFIVYRLALIIIVLTTLI